MQVRDDGELEEGRDCGAGEKWMRWMGWVRGWGDGRWGNGRNGGMGEGGGEWGSPEKQNQKDVYTYTERRMMRNWPTGSRRPRCPQTCCHSAGRARRAKVKSESKDPRTRRADGVSYSSRASRLETQEEPELCPSPRARKERHPGSCKAGVTLIQNPPRRPKSGPLVAQSG